MTGIASVSRTELEQRRQKLRRQRQVKIVQAIWRTLAVSGMTGGLLWTGSQPIWVLSAPKQIVISGNKIIPEQSIQSLLKLSYPQSLLKIEPTTVEVILEQQLAIEDAKVSRRLFPPGIVVQVKERIPVALTQPPIVKNQNANGSTKQPREGLLDANGVWMPLESYTSLTRHLKIPSLKIIALPEQYQSWWRQLYQALSQSPIKVMEIDCQDPSNFILKTDLGVVHLGADTSRINEQLKVLAQMRQLPSKLNPKQIEYIDLKNPDAPIVQMKDAKNSKN
ncbi:MAG: FtsQ-type POTRA domain-containing protein [Nostocaceae cyanobacterium]|nr:FtsQ-type POTRA domain-containing protein [Nostocaceae cyanobacterium]